MQSTQFTLHNLRRVLAGEHPVTGQYSTDAATARDQINAANIPVTKPISSAELLSWSALNGRKRNIEAAAAGTVPNVGSLPPGVTVELVQDVASAASLLIRRDSTELDLSLPDRQNMLGLLVAGGVLTQADSDSLIPLAADEPISHATQLTWPRVPISLIRQAMGDAPINQKTLPPGHVAQVRLITEEGVQPIEHYGAVTATDPAVPNLLGAWDDLLELLAMLNEMDGYLVIFEPLANFDPGQPNQPSLVADNREAQWAEFDDEALNF